MERIIKLLKESRVCYEFHRGRVGMSQDWVAAVIDDIPMGFFSGSNDGYCVVSSPIVIADSSLSVEEIAGIAVTLSNSSRVAHCHIDNRIATMKSKVSLLSSDDFISAIELFLADIRTAQSVVSQAIEKI